MRAGPFRSAYHGMAERRRKSLTKAGWLIRLTNDHSRLPFVTTIRISLSIQREEVQ
jgi:hypothetical protein